MGDSRTIDPELVEVLEKLESLNAALHTDVLQGDADAAERLLGELHLLERRRNLLVDRWFLVAEQSSPTRTVERNAVGLP